MAIDFLLVTTPFTQLNTPYPATAYLKGFLNENKIVASQCDLSIEVALKLFSRAGIARVFDTPIVGKQDRRTRSLVAQSSACVNVIDRVVAFLQGKEPSLAHLICGDDFLPDIFSQPEVEDCEWAFGVMGLQDKARHLATLFLEEISRYITRYIDPRFGLVRYAEQLARSASSFTPLCDALKEPFTLVDEIMIDALRGHIEREKPVVVAFSVPFPGNLFSALRCTSYLRENYPHITIAMGGGFVNTELRQITETRFFQWVDYLLLDDGELPLLRLHRYLTQQCSEKELVRTFCLRDGEVRFFDDETAIGVKESEKGTPDYAPLPLKDYLSVISIANPMHNLWSNGRWNKLTLAHGCYWAKCAFCDGSLDYISRYQPNRATQIVDRIEALITTTGERGFHFVDEAAPPTLLREVANEILKRNLTVVWWTNIRFEKSFSLDLCRLLHRAGCIAVSGGLEVASDRILKLINKGVTLEQVVRVVHALTQSGIMVHAYLMYGFPGQTVQETVNALEIVRQLFENGLVQSAFWHRFALTAHSPVGQSPQEYGIVITESPFGGFARNDLMFEEKNGIDHALFSDGLPLAVQNYMQGVGFDMPVAEWFLPHKMPKTTLSPQWVSHLIEQCS